jgi:radical SAM protein (TIGR01212 family)
MKQNLYRTIHEYWRERYGGRVQKVSLDAGFTCPNRDGSKAVGGCIYCNNDSFNFSPDASIHDQLGIGIERSRKRFGAKKFIAYFQTYTNTYGSPDHLQKLYSAIYDFPEVVGLAIGTRPDCVPEDVLKVVEGFVPTHEVWLEYGLESSSDDSLKRLNRAHTFDEFKDALLRTTGRGIKIGTHIIVGLPWEDEFQMLKTAREVAALPVDGIKIHNLHVVRGTALERMHQRAPLQLLSLQEYATIAARILELLPPEMVIMRLTADCPESLLVAPSWTNRKREIVAVIESELQTRGSFQGSLHETSSSGGRSLPANFQSIEEPDRHGRPSS